MKTKADYIMEKEALKLPKSKAIATAAFGVALHGAPQEAKGQASWLSRKVFAPLVESLQGSYKMPALDTTRAATHPPHWITEKHPVFPHYADEIRRSMNDSTLGIKGMSVDTMRVGKDLKINVLAADDAGDFTHRLHRIEGVPLKGHEHLKGMEQNVGTINNSEAKNYIAQRNQSWLARAKHSLAAK